MVAQAVFRERQGNGRNGCSSQSGERQGGGARHELIIAGIISVALGVLIFLAPRLLNYIVAAYLIIVGVIWLIAGL